MRIATYSALRREVVWHFIIFLIVHNSLAMLHTTKSILLWHYRLKTPSLSDWDLCRVCIRLHLKWQDASDFPDIPKIWVESIQPPIRKLYQRSRLSMCWRMRVGSGWSVQCTSRSGDTRYSQHLGAKREENAISNVRYCKILIGCRIPMAEMSKFIEVVSMIKSREGTASIDLFFERSSSFVLPEIILRDVTMKGRKWRARSVEHILGELEMFVRRSPNLPALRLTMIFLCLWRWVDEWVLRALPKEVGIPFECLLIPPLLRPNMFKRLADAGLFVYKPVLKVVLPKSPRKSTIASGNVPSNLGDNKELKLNIVYDVIIDNPHATEEMKLETAEFLLELPRPYDIYFYSLNYFPGTALTKKSLEDGSLDPNLVEGKATKAWRQFRVSMDWPRSDEDKSI